MIENDVPVPSRRPNPGAKYDFAKLLPGQSVFEQCAKDDRKKVRNAAYRVADYKKWEIVVRSFEKGIRVWRIN